MAKKRPASFTKYIVAALALFVPFLALAYNEVQNGLQTNGRSGLFGFGGGGLSSASSAQELIMNVIKLMLIFAGGIAVVYVIIGGYFYVTSAGNEEQVESAKKGLQWSLIGFAVALLAYTIINAVQRILTSNPPA